MNKLHFMVRSVREKGKLGYDPVSYPCFVSQNEKKDKFRYETVADDENLSDYVIAEYNLDTLEEVKESLLKLLFGMLSYNHYGRKLNDYDIRHVRASDIENLDEITNGSKYTEDVKDNFNAIVVDYKDEYNTKIYLLYRDGYDIKYDFESFILAFKGLNDDKSIVRFKDMVMINNNGVMKLRYF